MGADAVAVEGWGNRIFGGRRTRIVRVDRFSRNERQLIVMQAEIEETEQH